MIKNLFVFISIIICSHSFGQKNIISDLKVQGNKRTKTSFIKNIASIQKGAVLDSSLIEKDIKLLRRLPSVSHAYYQVFHSHDNQYNVFYNIEENFTLIPTASIYTTNDDEFAYRLGINEFNTFGRNIAIGGFFQRDVFNSYALSFRAPYLFSNKFGISITHQSLTTQEPIFFDNGSANYKYNNKSIEALGLYQVDFKNKIELGLNYFIEDYEYIEGSVSPEVPQESKIDKYLVKGIYEYNNLDFYYQYISGFKSQLNIQYVKPTDNTFSDFFIAWNDFFFFKRINTKGNWGSRLRIGFSKNEDTPFAPFSVDNNINIRGVGNTIDRGTGVIVLNTEYRYTLIDKKWFTIQGNTFLDAGTWRQAGGSFSDFTELDNIRVYPGLGFRFIHKKIYNATFRIDYGIGITPNATKGIVFGIGQYF